MKEEQEKDVRAYAKNHYCHFCSFLDEELVEASFLFWDESRAKVIPVCEEHKALMEPENFFLVFSLNWSVANLTTVEYIIMVKKMNWIVRFLTPNWVTGICLSPFGIYIHEAHMNNQRIVNHERIHWQQQLEMLVLFFYLWYLIEWVIKLFKYGKQSYYNISFERECRDGQYDNNYLKKRKAFTWIKYLRI